MFLSARTAALLMVATVGVTDGRAQSPAPGQSPVLPRLVLPPITVTALKEPAPVEKVPASVTAVTGARLDLAGLTTVSDAALFAPNTYYSDLSARKISNARFRGIGSSPSNPGITTFIDGVPQLSTNTANIELLDVAQVEFVRGAQSALFGRNTLGGIVNVTSRRPSLSAWSGRATAPLGSDGERAFTVAASGPIVAGRIGGGLALDVSRRNGYTQNVVTGNLLDDRSSVSFKGQVAFIPEGPWSAQIILSGERDRDGDYALGDLAALRSDPFTVARDFEGYTDRNVFGTTVLLRHEGSRVSVSSTTGVVDWRTEDETDLDYTPFPAARRKNLEAAVQFTQEVRVASAATAPYRLNDTTTLAWQAGVFFFTQRYDQDAVNSFAPFVLSPGISFPVANHSPQAALDDRGLGVFGHATATLGEHLDLSAGLRFDREHRKGDLQSFFDPVIAPANVVSAERTYTSASPQFAAAWRPSAGRTVYASVGQGFKAGGFNPAAPQGNESYGEERAWHLEGGLKASLLRDRATVSAALFSIDWSALQLNLPNPFVPAQFYIANVGDATSRGVEIDVQARALDTLTLFAALGTTRARFSDGSVSSGVDVGGNRIPLTPRFTMMAGAEFAQEITRDLALRVRGDVTGYGAFEYDDLNTARQDAYAVANLRGGVTVGSVLIEGWVRNLFDTKYVPVAFAYDPSSAPSGFLGEPGRPRTAGIRVSVEF